MTFAYHYEENIHRSTTLKSHTVEMNYLDSAATVQYSAGKLWIMALSWMPSDTNHTKNTAQEQPEEYDKELKLSTWPQNAPNLIEPHCSRKKKKKKHPQHSEW